MVDTILWNDSEQKVVVTIHECGMDFISFGLFCGPMHYLLLAMGQANKREFQCREDHDGR
jgi:hypothetical protein